MVFGAFGHGGRLDCLSDFMLRCWERDFVDFDIGEVVGICCFRAWDGWKWTVVGFANTQ